MEQKLRRLPDGTYTGAMTDEHICGIFGCCGDWNRREVRIGALTVYVYAIDGITSGGDASEYVVKPLMAGRVRRHNGRALRPRPAPDGL